MQKAVEIPVLEKWTYQDFDLLPPDLLCEIIDCNLYMSPTLIPEHQRISRKLEYQLIEFVEENSLGEVFQAPLDIVFTNGRVLNPDVFFIANENKNIIGEKAIVGSPNLVIEIV